jgi:3'-5' exoribonuclease
MGKNKPANHIWVKDITEQSTIQGLYLAKEKRVGVTRNNKPFISLSLSDRTGEIEARIWEGAEEISQRFEEGDVVEIEGDADSYRGQIQIRISGLRMPEGKVDPDIFLESAPVDISELMQGLKKVLGTVENPHLKALIDGFLGDQEFLSHFKKAPAAKGFHHNYVGGLLEHTLSVCRLAQRVAEHYTGLDKDLLVTGAFLHDIGKTRELTYGSQVEYTDEGRLVGHLVQGVSMLDQKVDEIKGFPKGLSDGLRHMILSHHGEHEFGSPKRPKFLEAYALHLMDDLDAKMNGLKRFMERDRREGEWTEFNRMFERYFFKGDFSSPEESTSKRRTGQDKQGRLFSS